MLQLRRLHRDAVAGLRSRGELPRGPVPVDELPAVANHAIARVRAERQRLAARLGGVTRLRERLDRALRTDELEHLDDPAVSESDKLLMIEDLHRHNRLVGAYTRFSRVLRPLLREAAARRRGPARLLELASGYGELALALGQRSRQWSEPVVITGSDVVPAYVASANERARARGSDVAFREVDALRLDGVAPDSVDVVLIAQSVHHFDAGGVAAMIAASARIATTAFVAIDGCRAASLFPLLFGTTRLLPRITHDSFLSARRFYSEPELELLASLAVGPDGIRVWTSVPGWSVLEVRPAPGGRRAVPGRAAPGLAGNRA